MPQQPQRRQPDSVALAEAWWALIARVLTFLGGMALLAFVVVTRDERMWLVGIALTAVGLPVAGFVRQALVVAMQQQQPPQAQQEVPPQSGGQSS